VLLVQAPAPSASRKLIFNPFKWGWGKVKGAFSSDDNPPPSAATSLVSVQPQPALLVDAAGQDVASAGGLTGMQDEQPIATGVDEHMTIDDAGGLAVDGYDAAAGDAGTADAGEAAAVQDPSTTTTSTVDPVGAGPELPIQSSEPASGIPVITPVAEAVVPSTPADQGASSADDVGAAVTAARDVSTNDATAAERSSEPAASERRSRGSDASTDTTKPSNKSKEPQVVLIAGLLTGMLALLLAVIVLVICVRYRRRALAPPPSIEGTTALSVRVPGTSGRQQDASSTYPFLAVCVHICQASLRISAASRV
jgi:hypothetical protein